MRELNALYVHDFSTRPCGNFHLSPFNCGFGVEVANPMVVRTLTRGRDITGLLVGAGNVRRFFPKGIASIELQLDHLNIRCDLSPEFWKDQPEIHDRRLNAWLEAKHYHAKPGQDPVALALIPAGENAFRLRTVSANGHPHN